MSTDSKMSLFYNDIENSVANRGDVKVIASKLHGIKITQADLHYHGSITIDSDLLELANMLPLEFVYIWNKNSGTRIETYVFPGERGSGVVCLNGAAARSCAVGDEVIIASTREITMKEYMDGFTSTVLTFDHSDKSKINTVLEVFKYSLETDKNGKVTFSIK